jgi:excinuclease ABC subunit B
LLDPSVEVCSSEGQLADVLERAKVVIARQERILVTTVTKKQAEDVVDWLLANGVLARYLHSDVGTLERIALVRDLRLGRFDVLVGVNLLREGLDLPEVSLVAILDADKEGFLRSETALLQTMGRAARNERGHVVLYADRVTNAMQAAITVVTDRRALQEAWNEEHGMTPSTVTTKVRDLLAQAHVVEKKPSKRRQRAGRDETLRGSFADVSLVELEQLAEQCEADMLAAAAALQFEKAAELRDKLEELLNESMGRASGA